MRLLFASSASCLLLFSKALTIPVSSSVNATSITDSPSQSLRCSDLGPRAYSSTSADASNATFQDTSQDDPLRTFNLTSSFLSRNASLVGSDSNDKWHGDMVYWGKAICATAALVNAAHALAMIALKNLVAEQLFTVKNYNEVQIKVRQFHAEFTRRQAAIGIFAAIQRMYIDDQFETSTFTFLLGNKRMGSIDFIGWSCSSTSCGANVEKSSLPLVVPSNESSGVTGQVGPPQPAATILANTVNDNDPDMELDCEWHGRRVDPRRALLAPSSILTYSHLVTEDPMKYPTLRDIIDDEIVGMKFVLLATPHPSPTAPLWSHYWAIRALGMMPEKMAEKWDWREMTMRVRVDDFLIGTISLFNGKVHTASGPSVLGSNNGSILVA